MEKEKQFTERRLKDFQDALDREAVSLQQSFILSNCKSDLFLLGGGERAYFQKMYLPFHVNSHTVVDVFFAKSTKNVSE